MLEIFENEDLKATQLLNEEDYLIGQWHWSTWDREWAYEQAMIMKKEVLEYRKERERFGYTKGVRRGLD